MMQIFDYRSRAIAGRGHNSKIAFLAIKLPHKKQIKKLFLAWNLRGAATNRERPVVARLRYLKKNSNHEIQTVILFESYILHGLR